MSNYKRWPIGLQSGPNGTPTGIGKVIQTLTDENIAMFSASTDSMSILFDLQRACQESGIPHTGNYRPTGYVNGYHLEVPEYGQAPSEKAAKRHWDMVEKRGLPPEIDWDIPCIWISTWNEVRPYVGWAQAGSGAHPENPVEGYTGNADWLGHWAVSIGKEAVARGYRWAAFGFAGGDPEPGFWEAPGMIKYLQLCQNFPDHLGIALHEYAHDLSLLGKPEKIGRFQKLHAVCDVQNIQRPIIQFKEFGWEERRIPPRESAIQQLIEVAKIYMNHTNIHGAAIWTVRPWGDNIHEYVRDLIPFLEAAALEHAQLYLIL